MRTCTDLDAKISLIIFLGVLAAVALAATFQGKSSSPSHQVNDHLSAALLPLR